VKNYENISPDLLRAELTRLGFEEVDSEGRSGSTWVDPIRAERPAVLVPRDELYGVPGFSELIESAVERIAWIMDRSVHSAIEALTERGDRFELRLMDDTTVGGHLPLLRAPAVFDGFFQLLKGGARAEFRGTRARYTGPDPEAVTTALQGIDLLAPEEGSFRLIAVSSVQAQLPLDLAIAEPDKSRRALAATVRGLHATAETTAHAIPTDVDRLVPAIDGGVSNTLLHGLEQISSNAPGLAIEFAIRWDPFLPPANAPEGSTIRLRPEQLHRVPKLAERLRPHDWDEHRIVRGWVKTAIADALAEAGHPSGLVIVQTEFGGRSRLVTIDLPSEAFEFARPGVSSLTAKGTLERISGRWHLTDPRDIEISET
jgi:hypothetical protein